MNPTDVNSCMTVLDIFGSNAPDFIKYVADSYPVTRDGDWGTTEWWNQMVAKYTKTRAIACGGGVLASAAEFAGSSHNVPAEVYLRLWTLMAPFPQAREAFVWLGSFGGKYIPSLRQYLNSSISLIYENCDNGKMSVSNALGLIECLDSEHEAQNRLIEYVAEADESLLPLAFFLKGDGGIQYGLSQIC